MGKEVGRQRGEREIPHTIYTQEETKMHTQRNRVVAVTIVLLMVAGQGGRQPLKACSFININ